MVARGVGDGILVDHKTGEEVEVIVRSPEVPSAGTGS